MQQDSFYFDDGPYLKILKGLYNALRGEEAFITLIGKAQTGKSKLCEKLVQYLIYRHYRVIYFDRGIESPEMLQTLLAQELNLPDSHNFPRLLEESRGNAEGGDDKPIILIFDDAHFFSNMTLAEIYRLTGIQLGVKRMLNILLCGEPGLEKRLRSRKEFKQLRLLISMRFYLKPMDPDTLNQFLILYLEAAGRPGLRLEAAAASKFYKLCKGYPGAAANLCRLMVDARSGASELSAVGKKELENLLRRSIPTQNSSKSFRKINRWIIAGPLAIIMFIVALVLGAFD